MWLAIYLAIYDSVNSCLHRAHAIYKKKEIQSTDQVDGIGPCSGMKHFLSVCVEFLRPSQPNGVMSSAVSLPNHTFTGQA